MTTKLSRRKTLLRGSLTAIALTIAGQAGAAGQFDGVTLTIATWGGSWKENIESVIVPKFEALGGKIEFVTGSPQANLAKLIAARGQAPFDVMEALDAQEKDLFSDDSFLQKIDLSKIPNTADLDDWQYNEWRVGSWNTQETICYNKDKFAELGIEPPKTYTDLINEKLAGRISIPDITSGGGLANFGALAYAAGGDETNVQPALELINKLNALKFWSRGGEVITQMQTGDVYAAIMHAGWCVRAHNAGVPVATTHPVINDEHTGVNKYGWLVVLKNSKHPDAAAWYINEYLSPEFQYILATKSGVVPDNKKAIARLDEDPVLKELLMLDPEMISKSLRIDYGKANIADWTDQWNRSVSQ